MTAQIDTDAIMAAIRSIPMESGLFERFEGHETKGGQAVGGLVGECFFSGFGPVPAGSGLSATTARLEITARLRMNALREPLDGIELDMMRATATLIAAYSTDFTLGGLIKNIDLLGSMGDPLRAIPGYITLDKTMYRAVGIPIPMIINDVWEQVP